MQQSNTKGVQDQAWQGGNGDSLGIMQEIEFWPYHQMIYAQTRTHPQEWDIKFSGILRFKYIIKSWLEDQT